MSNRPARSPLLLVAVLAASSVVALASPRTVAAWSSGTFSSASERELVSLTNRSRASAGLRSLRVDSTLTAVARWRSKDMIDRDYFSHSIPGYGSVFKKLDSKGYCYRVAGENIGWNTYPDDEATAAIHQMFMDSAGHRENILGKAWEVIGIGAYKGSDGKKMWTVLFADKCGSTASVSKPKPKPKPAAAKATPRPTAKPTPRPTAKPTPAPTPAPTPTPTPLATAPIEAIELDDASDPRTPTDGRSDAGAPSSRLRVVEASTGSGLVDTIVGGVTRLFFGT
jgi:uncharacterized protein YkwD